jgi:hypothetical protein
VLTTETTVAKKEIKKADWFDDMELADAEDRQRQKERAAGYDDRQTYLIYDPKINSKAPHYIEGWLSADAEIRKSSVY